MAEAQETEKGAISSNMFILGGGPTDIITSVNFSGNSTLLATSFDKTAYLYNVEENTLIFAKTLDAPILDADFLLEGDSKLLVTGGIDQRVHYIDANTDKEQILGTHEGVIRCMKTMKEKGIIVSGSWDKSVKLWNLTTKNHLIQSVPLSEKIYAMDLKDNLIACGTADKHIHFLDIRKLSTPIERRKSPLQSQIRSIAILSQEKIALGTIDGKIAIEPVGSGEKGYSFRGHRTVLSDQAILYPVNALALHPIYSTLATGGSDALACIWDVAAQKRIFKVHFPTSVLGLAFNHMGTKLAIATSYNRDGGFHEYMTKEQNYIFFVIKRVKGFLNKESFEKLIKNRSSQETKLYLFCILGKQKICLPLHIIPKKNICYFEVKSPANNPLVQHLLVFKLAKSEAIHNWDLQFEIQYNGITMCKSEKTNLTVYTERKVSADISYLLTSDGYTIGTISWHMESHKYWAGIKLFESTICLESANENPKPNSNRSTISEDYIQEEDIFIQIDEEGRAEDNNSSKTQLLDNSDLNIGCKQLLGKRDKAEKSIEEETKDNIQLDISSSIISKILALQDEFRSILDNKIDHRATETATFILKNWTKGNSGNLLDEYFQNNNAYED